MVGHVIQGTKILLKCKVQAARPAANVTWQNGTQYLSESNERFEMFETKVEENVSKYYDIVFTINECMVSTLIKIISPFKKSLFFNLIYLIYLLSRFTLQMNN